MKTRIYATTTVLFATWLVGCSEPECSDPAAADPECSDEVATADVGDRQFDPQTGKLEPVAGGGSQRATTAAGVRISRLAISPGAAARGASYLLELTNGKQYKAQITHRIQRDGAEEVVTVQDADTGQTVEWAIQDEQVAQTADDGRTVVMAVDDYDPQKVMITTPDGGWGTVSYAGVVEGSPQEAENDMILALAMLGSAPLTYEQVTALSAAAAVAEADLGATSMGLGRWLQDKWRQNIRPVLQNSFCNPGMGTLCALSLGVGLATLELGGGLAVAFGGGCLVIRATVCP